MKLELPYPPKELSPNASRKLHWGTRTRIKKQYQNECYILARQVNPRRVITLTFHPPSNRPKRNIDNAIASFKHGLDAVAQAWKLDDSEILINYTPTFGEVTPFGKVVIS